MVPARLSSSSSLLTTHTLFSLSRVSMHDKLHHDDDDDSEDGVNSNLLLLFSSFHSRGIVCVLRSVKTRGGFCSHLMRMIIRERYTFWGERRMSFLIKRGEKERRGEDENETRPENELTKIALTAERNEWNGRNERRADS